MREMIAPIVGAKLLAVFDSLYSILTNSDLGSFASVFGAGLSFWVLLSVSDIRRRFLLRLRAPETIKDLAERASAISNAMQDFDAGLPTIEEQLALANETLKNCCSKMTGDSKKTIRDAMKAIKEFRTLSANGKSRERAWGVYVHLLVSAKAIENVIADSQKEP